MQEPAIQLTWLPFGLAMGTTFGILFDDLAMWMSLGLCLGLSLSVAFGALRNERDDGGAEP